jgi:hypothetical protein
MMMNQFSMLMLMMSSAALIHSQNVYFFCRYFHICSSSFASLQILGIIRESRDIRELQNFHHFWHFWSGVNTECNNISGNHILWTHLSIHNLLWRFQAVQHHKSLSWANTNYHCAANSYLTSCGGNWINIYFFYQNLVGLRKKLNVPLFLCFTLPPSFTLKNDTTWLEACRVL